MLYVAAFGAAMGVGAFALPVQAETLFTDVASPTEPFTVVSSVAMKVDAPQITLLSPNAGFYYPGEEVEVVWDASGRGVSFVNVWMSADGGYSYELLASEVPSYATYTWVVPEMVTRHVIFAVEATDLLSVLAVDYSDGIIGTTILPPYAESPISGEEEGVSAVQPGDFIVAPGFPEEVYYVNDYMERQPFLDAETLITYDSPEATLVGVTDATLTTLPLWYPMVPNPGKVLVQFDDEEKVYAVEGSADIPFLRWITNEEIAELNFGPQWKSYVLKVPASLRRSYYVGSDIVSDIDADTTLLVDVEYLHEKARELEAFMRGEE